MGHDDERDVLGGPETAEIAVVDAALLALVGEVGMARLLAGAREAVRRWQARPKACPTAPADVAELAAMVRRSCPPATPGIALALLEHRLVCELEHHRCRR